VRPAKTYDLPLTAAIFLPEGSTMIWKNDMMADATRRRSCAMGTNPMPMKPKNKGKGKGKKGC
jgi:hypothetical protein